MVTYIIPQYNIIFIAFKPQTFFEYKLVVMYGAI